MKKITALSLALALLCSGCSAQKKDETVWPDSDQMWNRFNVMETETGYYFNGSSSLFLQYRDKATGNEIFLCDKPECPHDGRDTCVATYKDMHCSKVILCNGALYFAGVESDGENVTASVYRAAPDGSSVDRLCTLMTLKYTSESAEIGFMASGFTVHRGYAFADVILTDVSKGSNFAGYIGGGLCKANLRTNEVTVIKEYRDYWDDEYRMNGEFIWTCGDNIIYQNRKSGMLRMNIKSGVPEKIQAENSSGFRYYPVASDGNTLYIQKVLYEDENKVRDTMLIQEYDPETMECTAEYTLPGGASYAYDGILYVTPWKNEYKDYKSSLVAFDRGKEIFSTENLPGDSSTQANIGFKSGKIFISVPDDETGYPFSGNTYYSCRTDDFLSGNISWKEEYNTDSLVERRHEYVMRIAENGGIFYDWSNF